MQKSRVREKMRRQEPILCTAIHFPNASLAELIGQFGFDCLWVCTEHVATDMSLLEHIVRAGRLTGMDVMVRVVRGNHDDLIRPLEFGAKGLMIPRLRTPEEVAQIVYDTRFYPLGKRGIDGANPDADMGFVSIPDYIRFANDHTFIVVQVEDAEAVDCVEEIAAVEGIDVIFIGPADLSQSYGVPGQLKHPKIIEAIERSVAACEKHGIYCGTPGLDVDYTKMLMQMGVKFLTAPGDFGLLYRGFREVVDVYSQLGFTFAARQS
ncbi:MAG: HpcH/HpaI aldolase family protein [Limnochordia bacterium]|jgi:2-keto-3-deoxy-L-rhamnonate aldolase RhmA